MTSKLATKLKRFIGTYLFDSSDELEIYVTHNGYSFSILDPSFQSNIDVNDKRFNVHVDNEQKILKFSIG
jgi:hypothetical protein